MNSNIFKAYDIRGIYPAEIDEEAAARIAKAYTVFVRPKNVVLGRDVRISSPSLWRAMANAFMEMGVDVIDVGVIATDMLYFTVANYGYDGGITVTASHSPVQYNGMKLVRQNSEPISSDTGLAEICKLAEANDFKPAEKPGKIIQTDIFDDYIAKVLSFVDADLIKKMQLKITVNPNFGAGGKTVQRLSEILDLELEKLNFEPDGTFPKGRPDPMITELRTETSRLVKESESNLGASWDSDADRCFVYDEYGRFVDAYYLGTLLAEIFLHKDKGAKIIHDPRLIWAIDDTIEKFGGESIMIKAGHAFFKERMRKEDAVFGMETSGHFYFRDYFYCDNGMIPFLLILEKMAQTGKKLSELIDPIRFKYPVSEEVNFRVNDVAKVMADIEEKNKTGKIEHIDGLSVEYKNWRFNVRPSNTENLVRLNVEAKTRDILDPMKAEIIKDIKKDIAEF